VGAPVSRLTIRTSPPEDRAWERWADRAKIGTRCEIVATWARGLEGKITAFDDDRVTVLGDDKLTYILDWSDVGPATGY